VTKLRAMRAFYLTGTRPTTADERRLGATKYRYLEQPVKAGAILDARQVMSRPGALTFLFADGYACSVMADAVEVLP